MPDFLIITLDGGAASGKSSTARALAKRLNLLHVDTGSHYRAITCYLTQRGIAPDDRKAIADSLKHGDLIGYVLDGQQAVLTLQGEIPDPDLLRSQAVNRQVSAFAAVPIVRDYLKEYQRSFISVAADADYCGLVMEGRDIGSVILPDAPHKFFIEADQDTRAARRAAEGESDTIATRDALDAGRKNAPLTCPEGAVRIDTSHIPLEAVVDKILNMIGFIPNE